MATPAPNPRASLLSGLRTGGVRSISGSNNIPHTAAPAGTFNIPRIVSTPHNDALFPPEEEDELSNMISQNLYLQNQASRLQQPVTAAVDGSANRFAHQQVMGMGMGGGMPYNGMNAAQAQAQLQALQLQMMQVEIARLQALQAQQYQEQLLAQAQLAQQAQRRQVQQQATRRAVGLVPPATAGPTGSFDLRAATTAAQMRRANQVDQLRSRLGVGADEQVPMTAAIGGKFGSRVTSARYDPEDDDFSSTGAKPPSTPNHTTVISGGTSLGSPMSNNMNSGSASVVPSKSDAAVSWRRSSTSNSVLGANRAVSSPTVKITPPPGERVSPPLEHGAAKFRPTPLQFSAAASQPLPATVAVEGIDEADGDDSSSVSSKSNSSPSTPHTASSAGDAPPLSPREEAAKKLYEGLGIGRSLPTISVAVPQEKEVVVQRLVSHPVRQPRGPPSNNEELLPKNFATRSRRKAIGALLDARERREVEAF
ncbi:hypothetical protein OBBRIDRAFT_790141 [Obba rivulosa]|uniref:Uncharacterized protein n=1 Tax=Obba rivulosa TaxID=1052685 RepID=A0A8E2J2X6_9APHY|nr:hypothetical protein OBBRIDRAFT_790141 [Obba rivulosa]